MILAAGCEKLPSLGTLPDKQLRCFHTLQTSYPSVLWLQKHRADQRQGIGNCGARGSTAGRYTLVGSGGAVNINRGGGQFRVFR